MKHLVLSLALVSALILPIRALADAPSIIMDGVEVRTDAPPVVDQGRVFVPLRGILERFNATVYFETGQTVVAQRNGLSIRVTAGSRFATVDDRTVEMDAPAREVAGRVEVPLRFVAESLGIAVDYDELTNTIVLVSGLAEPETSVIPSEPAVVSDRGGMTLARTAGLPASVDDERPANGALVGSQFPEIYARLQQGSSPVDPQTIRVVVDGEDVTASSTVSSAYVSYTPPTAMRSGTHVVEITGDDESGAPFETTWSFRVDDDMSGGYIGSVIGYEPPRHGYRRFGYFPPGFSLFSPGPGYFFAGQPILIVFFSPFYPYGTGFFTISGFPGQFAMTPWFGCPGYFYAMLTVPYGIAPHDGVLAARFLTADGRSVAVRATAPVRIDGMRHALPEDIHFAEMATLVQRPVTPRATVAFQHVDGGFAYQSMPAVGIARRPAFVSAPAVVPATLQVLPVLRPTVPPALVPPPILPVRPALPVIPAPHAPVVIPATPVKPVPPNRG